VNGAPLKDSAPVLPGDVVQTREGAAANLSAAGSSVLIQANTIVRFQSGGLALDHGGASVATGKGLAVFARDFKIAPASSDWTEFYVTRASGVIQIMARKNSVTVSCGANISTLKEGQQMSRDDAADCGIANKRASGAPAAAKGPLLTSPVADAVALGAGAALLIWTLTRQEDAVSPSAP
jgi:ferric-dicitrate binding protein FerR (iron transport regulator)